MNFDFKKVITIVLASVLFVMMLPVLASVIDSEYGEVVCEVCDFSDDIDLLYDEQSDIFKIYFLSSVTYDENLTSYSFDNTNSALFNVLNSLIELGYDNLVGLQYEGDNIHDNEFQMSMDSTTELLFYSSLGDTYFQNISNVYSYNFASDDFNFTDLEEYNYEFYISRTNELVQYIDDDYLIITITDGDETYTPYDVNFKFLKEDLDLLTDTASLISFLEGLTGWTITSISSNCIAYTDLQQLDYPNFKTYTGLNGTTSITFFNDALDNESANIGIEMYFNVYTQ